MKPRALLIILALVVGLPWSSEAFTRDDLVCPVREEWVEGSEECPCEKDWKPTAEQLQEILDAHAGWVKHRGWSDPSVPGQALLCGMNLSLFKVLEGANLTEEERASLTKDANPILVDLIREKQSALGEGRYLVELAANPDFASFGDAGESIANFIKGAQERTATSSKRLANLAKRVANLFEGGHLGIATLKGADLSWASLEGADLSWASLEGADLTGLNLEGVNLSEVNLEGAKLLLSNLENANLTSSNLGAADLNMSNIKGADLTGSNLEGAYLFGVNLKHSHLAFVKLHKAAYAPASSPPDAYLEGMEGLATVWFPVGRQSGLVQLRELLQKAGLRDLEREATFAIEHNMARHSRQSGSPIERFAGWLQLIFFEWTTGWGLYPSRALVIMLGVMAGMAIVYTMPITIPPASASDRHGIYRVWPRERLEPSAAGMTAADNIRVDRLIAGMPAVFAWAFYFSMLSAFHIGWRDLNVGSWITRIQPTEFALRGRGWVRIASGLQSLISVYLVAMWVLTYFGRPFQ